MIEWVNVKDRLPDKSIESVIVYWKYKPHVTLLSVDYYFYKNDVSIFGISHWRPLPPIPDEMRNSIIELINFSKIGKKPEDYNV